MDKFNMLPMYADLEFTELSTKAQIISIGIVSELGNRFYAEFTDYTIGYDGDASHWNWMMDHVINNLRYPYGHTPMKTEVTLEDSTTEVFVCGDRNKIRAELLAWIEQEISTARQVVNSSINKIQFVLDTYAYDWVLIVDLLTGGGTALDMPNNIYYIPFDIATYLQSHDIDPDISREMFADIDSNDDKHNSLYDALVIKRIVEIMNNA